MGNQETDRIKWKEIKKNSFWESGTGKETGMDRTTAKGRHRVGKPRNIWQEKVKRDLKKSFFGSEELVNIGCKQTGMVRTTTRGQGSTSVRRR